MKLTITAMALFANAALAWSPPPNPDPQAILNSAESVSMRLAFTNPFLTQNVTEADKADATAQLVWFYENALAIDPALSGVRQSFALSSWKQLGDSYPPALEQLIATRDLRVERVHQNASNRNAFFDAASINRYLKDDENTVQLFLWVDQSDSASAGRVYDMAQPALVRTHRYSTCMKYLDPDKALASAARMFAETKNIPEPDVGLIARLLGATTSPSSFAEKNFTNKSTTIVALLAVSGDHIRAREIARRAEAIYDSPQFKVSMENALQGNVPAPWPSQN